jgi:hypothetical protein
MNIPIFKKKEKIRLTKDELFTRVYDYYKYCDVSEMKLIYRDETVIIQIKATEVRTQS